MLFPLTLQRPADGSLDGGGGRESYVAKRPRHRLRAAVTDDAGDVRYRRVVRTQQKDGQLHPEMEGARTPAGANEPVHVEELLDVAVELTRGPSARAPDLLKRRAQVRGTTFSVFLPCTSTAVNVERVEPEPRPLGGVETVLVIDDEPGIRKVVSLVLASAGDKVMTAASGQEAVDLLAGAQVADAVALILLDVSMPGMSGRELRRRLRTLVPRARVVYFTGYAFEATDASDRVVDKPVTEAQLLRAVRGALDGS